MDREALRNILIEETTNYNSDALVRFAMYKPSLIFTDEFHSAEQINYSGGVIVGSSLGPHVFYALMTGFITVMILRAGYNKELNHNGVVTAAFFSVSLIFFLLFRIIKFLNPVIQIDRTGITVDDCKIIWPDVKYSGILCTIESRGGMHHDYLIIVDLANHIYKFNLHLILPNEIAPIVEYYKGKSKTSAVEDQSTSSAVPSIDD